MAKKRNCLLGAVIFSIVFGGVIYFLTDRVDMTFAKEAEVYFIYRGVTVVHSLENSELEILRDIFDRKKLQIDNPSCGFSEDISIKFNKEQTFCIARDTCPIVYWKEANRYIMISEDEKAQLYGLLEEHGFFFPCI